MEQLLAFPQNQKIHSRLEKNKGGVRYVFNNENDPITFNISEDDTEPATLRKMPFWTTVSICLSSDYDEHLHNKLYVEALEGAIFSVNYRLKIPEHWVPYINSGLSSYHTYVALPVTQGFTLSEAHITPPEVTPHSFTPFFLSSYTTKEEAENEKRIKGQEKRIKELEMQAETLKEKHTLSKQLTDVTQQLKSIQVTIKQNAENTSPPKSATKKNP